MPRYPLSMQEIIRKSLLYRTAVEYGDYTINHVSGCGHGCTYPCYAFMMAKRFGKVKTYDEWCEPKIVGNTLDLLDRELPRLTHKIGYVHLCFSTDPFMMGHDEVAGLSLEIIARLNARGIKVTTLTKGLYPGVLSDNGFLRNNEYGITLVSLAETHREKYEPYAASCMERIESLKALHDAGLRTWVSIEPYPTPNIIGQDLTQLLAEIDFVDRIVFGRLNYSKDVGLYRDYAGFYDECAMEVRRFCRDQGIESYIKRKTTTQK